MGFAGLTGCASTPAAKEGDQFFSGQVEIKNHQTEKTHYLKIDVAIRPQDNVRIESYFGALGYPVGVLTMNSKQALLLDSVRKKAYFTKKPKEALKRVLKTGLSPKDFIAIFTESFRMSTAWDCVKPTGDFDKECKSGDLKMTWKADGADKKLTFTSEKSTISIVYQKADRGKAIFKQKIPDNYKKIKL